MHDLFVIRAYSKYSRSAKALAKKLGTPEVFTTFSQYKKSRRSFDFIINWGSSRKIPTFYSKRMCFNHPSAVYNTTNKLKFFFSQSEQADPCRMPPFTIKHEEVIKWLEQGKEVVGRSILQGSGGRGIFFVEKPEDLNKGKLFTQYIKKETEWRLHFAFDKLIHTQYKGIKKDTPPKDWKIRNHSNGFIYIIDPVISAPEDVIHQAMLAYKNSGLDFGAVDVIYNTKKQKAYVLEINSAPGLEAASTLEAYNSAFLSEVNCP